MDERGWTQCQLACELGVSQAWISHACRDMRDTGTKKAAELLARVSWEVRFSPAVEEPVERREFLAGAASTVFVPASGRSNPYLDPDYVRLLADSLARSRYEFGGVPVAARALGHVRHVEGLLTRPLGGDWRIAASDLLYQAAIVLYDANRLVQAEHTGMVALDLAYHGRDHAARARAHDALSRIFLYRGDRVRAVQHAQRGLRLPDLPGSRAASLWMRLGRALATIDGRAGEAREALDRARDGRGLSAFAEVTLGGDVAIGLTRLGRYDEAGRLLERAAEAMARHCPLFHAQYLGRQIEVALKAGSPELAADRMRHLVRALPMVNSARTNRRVQGILNSSAAWDAVPEVRDARRSLAEMALPEGTA